MSDVTYNHPGVFITFEGVDGTGKTSLANALMKALLANPSFLKEHRYSNVVRIREPGSTTFANQIRTLFLNQREEGLELTAMTEALALIACKLDLIDKIIRPAMQAGAVVICDRYTRSLFAYQGAWKGIPFETLAALLKAAGAYWMPHLEFLIEASDETINERNPKFHNQKDEEACANREVIRAGYRGLAEKLPVPIVVENNGPWNETRDLVIDKAMRYMITHRIMGRPLTEYDSHL